MKIRNLVFRIIVLGVVLLSSLGCARSGTQPAAAVAAPLASTPAAAVTAPLASTPAPTAAAASGNPLQDVVRRATVRIVAQGSFREPEGVKLNSSTGGSGLIIDPSGLVVTNNHVVTGAALLKVYIPGEQEPRHAKVLGVSECSDLALLQLEGSGFPALKWYTGEISAGLDVFAAGYPLGDPEFTLTRGIVSKARASGKLAWASVPSVIEHDAALNPGNSGGPLVTKDGEVVGINFATSSRGQSRQYYAIAQAEAEKVIQQLRQGRDVDTIGLNGLAFVTDDDEFSGIWVFSVRSGSPADKAGIRPGDIVTQLEGVVLATDGTMGDYCDILRTHNSGDTLGVQVLRWDTKTWLEGQINGRQLTEVAKAAAPAATNAPIAAQASTPTPVPPTAPPASASLMVLPITFARDVDSNDQPIGAGTEFPADITKIHALFEYRNAPSGTVLRYVWYEGGEDIAHNETALSGNGLKHLSLHNGGQPVGSGSYRLELSLNGQVLQRGDFRIAAAPAPTAAPAQPTARPVQMVVTVQSYAYEQWGRPPIMDNPNGKCSPFNDGKPVRRLRVSLAIENRSQQAMTDWYGYFYKPDGSEAPTCYYTQNGGQPSIPPGKSAEITFLIYMERNETIAYGYIYDSRVGYSSNLYFPLR